MLKSKNIMVFKYQKYIDQLLAEGYSLPELYAPNGMNAYRYVFAADNSNNHKPVCIQNPARRLPDNEKFSGYALSCFDDKQKAKHRYEALCKSFKKTPKAIGDSLSGGKLANGDGLITEPVSYSGHFDLYESISCDLSKTFKMLELLWKE